MIRPCPNGQSENANNCKNKICAYNIKGVCSIIVVIETNPKKRRKK